MSNYAPRSNVPDPSFRRPRFHTLNGDWEFEFDDGNVGLKEHWEIPGSKEFSLSIVVPFCFQSELSGIGDTSFHDVVWYRRGFDVPDAFLGEYDRLFIKFGAVDYHAMVFLNGHIVGTHEGGFTPFECEVTHYLNGAAGGSDGENVLVVRVWDPSTDTSLPRGKQYWKERREGIYYDRVTGIWQPVWLEGRGRAGISSLRFTPTVDPTGVDVTAEFEGLLTRETTAEFVFTFNKVTYGRTVLPVRASTVNFSLDLSKLAADAGRFPYGILWGVDTPNLVDVDVYLREGDGVVDEVTSYFGIREVRVDGSRVLLNGEPLYQKLLLYQNYWPDGLYTAPTEAEFARDISLMKQMGFNGVRVHQAVADPYFLFEADKAGFLVWGEYANAREFTPISQGRLLSQWPAVVRRDYNHPCVVAWVPVNESWGVPALNDDPRQREFLSALYHLTRSLDPTRPVVDNDGWEHVVTDLMTIHQYVAPSFLQNVFPVHLDEFEEGDFNHMIGFRRLVVGGDSPEYRGEPVIMSEVGGFGLDLDALDRAPDRGEAWGYGDLLRSPAELEAVYGDLVSEYAKRPWIRGFCYTEFCDVFQEKNGLFTFDRRPKVNPRVIRKFNELIK
ncbi:MAG: sugar-binding domain-containing protein [Promethearchaeota archaeon]